MKVYVILNRMFGITHVHSIWFSRKNAEECMKELEDDFIGDTSASKFPFDLIESTVSDSLKFELEVGDEVKNVKIELGGEDITNW